MDSSRKKELINAYKQKAPTGGVFAVRCTATGKRWIDSTRDLAGMKNRFDFSVLTNAPIHHCLQADWRAHGASCFAYEVLETLAPKEGELPQDYRHSLEVLRDCLREEDPQEERYL